MEAVASMGEMAPAENSGTTAERYDGFTAQERAAMKEHAREQKKTAARRSSSWAEKETAAEQDVASATRRHSTRARCGRPPTP